MKKALILGGSKGIGNAFLKASHANGYEAKTLGSVDVNTDKNPIFISTEIRKYISETVFDLLLLNTGGMPPLEFNELTVGDSAIYEKAFRMYFTSYIELLNLVSISTTAKVILVSSHVIHNIEAPLAHSAAARSACETFLNYLPSLLNKPSIEIHSLRFGPVLTERLSYLLEHTGRSIDSLISKSPRSYVADVNDVYNLALFLTSPSSRILGTRILNLDSGISAAKITP